MGILKSGFSIVVAIFCLIGCASSTRTLLTTNLPKWPTKARDIEVFFEPPPYKARPLAIVSVSRDGENALWGVEALKSEAAELGADAITDLKMKYTTGFFPSLRLYGIAIKYE